MRQNPHTGRSGFFVRVVVPGPLWARFFLLQILTGVEGGHIFIIERMEGSIWSKPSGSTRAPF
jgi:hypothetical protein